VIQQQLLDLLQARTGHFHYESGHHGELWLDLDRLYLLPRSLEPFVIELSRRLAARGTELVCGPLVGGAFLAQLVARELDVDFCWAERIVTLDGVRYELPAPLREVVRGRRVAIVDDVINAGSAAGGMLLDLRRLGANVVGIGALLVLGDAIDKLVSGENIAIESIARRPNTLWDPATCPLCSAGVALDDLVPRA
jgi:orotate phosphoribosyltransferase